MSQRENIIADIVTTLETITKANSYTYDINTVTRDVKHFRELNGFPSILVLNGGQAYEPEDVGAGYLRSKLIVRLRGMVQATSDIETVANNFLDDIETALCASTSRRRGDYAEDTLPLTVRMYDGKDDDIQIFDFDFEIWYNYLYGSP